LPPIVPTPLSQWRADGRRAPIRTLKTLHSLAELALGLTFFFSRLYDFSIGSTSAKPVGSFRDACMRGDYRSYLLLERR